ncbi:MAG: DNA repair protein RadC [Ignavibacteria bacterium]|jgi:DNA repair protein RadC
MKDKTGYNQSRQTYTVHDLPQSERPRERLKENGAGSLASHELLAIILGSGSQGESVVVMAQKLLAHFGSLKAVFEASLEDLQKIKGLGPAKASQLLACFEIARRVNKKITEDEKENLQLRPVTSPGDIVELIKSKIINYSREQFLVVSFDTRNRILGTDSISTGTLTASLVHPRETFESAIRKHAASIIISHNHPSGDTEPSEEDMKITKRLSEAGKVMGIEVLDHIIVTKNGYFSFKEKGMI